MDPTMPTPERHDTTGATSGLTRRRLLGRLALGAAATTVAVALPGAARGVAGLAGVRGGRHPTPGGERLPPGRGRGGDPQAPDVRGGSLRQQAAPTMDGGGAAGAGARP